MLNDPKRSDDADQKSSWNPPEPIWVPEEEAECLFQDVSQRIANGIRKRIKNLGYQPEPHEVAFLKLYPAN